MPVAPAKIYIRRLGEPTTSILFDVPLKKIQRGRNTYHFERLRISSPYKHYRTWV